MFSVQREVENNDDYGLDEGCSYKNEDEEYYKRRQDLARRVRLATKVSICRKRLEAKKVCRWKHNFSAAHAHDINRNQLHTYASESQVRNSSLLLRQLKEMKSMSFRGAFEQQQEMMMVVKAIDDRVNQHVKKMKDEAFFKEIETKISKATESVVDKVLATNALYAQMFSQINDKHYPTQTADAFAKNTSSSMNIPNQSTAGESQLEAEGPSDFLKTSSPQNLVGPSMNALQSQEALLNSSRNFNKLDPQLGNKPGKQHSSLQAQSSEKLFPEVELPPVVTQNLNEGKQVQAEPQVAEIPSFTQAGMSHEENDQLTGETTEEKDVWEQIITKDAAIYEMSDDEEDTKERPQEGNKNDDKMKVMKNVFSASIEEFMPRYRWIKNGIEPPNSEHQIMKGKILFRAIVMTIVASIRWRYLHREKEKALVTEERKVIEEFIPEFELRTKRWFVNIVRIPIDNIISNHKLQLDPDRHEHLNAKKIISIFLRNNSKKEVERKKAILKSICMKLKVRLRSIVQSIVRALETDKPPMPKGLLSFLRRIILDGCVFPPGFLFEEEVKSLEFSSEGFTRWMVPFASPEAGKNDETLVYNFDRPILILSNFIIKRCLIPAILQPWIYSGTIEKAKSKNVQNNLLVISSWLYIFIQQLVGGPEGGIKEKKHIKKLGKFGKEGLKDFAKLDVIGKVKKNKVADSSEAKEPKSAPDDDIQEDENNENETPTYLSSTDLAGKLLAAEYFDNLTEYIDFKKYLSSYVKYFIVSLLHRVLQSDANISKSMLTQINVEIGKIKQDLDSFVHHGSNLDRKLAAVDERNKTSAEDKWESNDKQEDIDEEVVQKSCESPEASIAGNQNQHQHEIRSVTARSIQDNLGDTVESVSSKQANGGRIQQKQEMTDFVTIESSKPQTNEEEIVDMAAFSGQDTPINETEKRSTASYRARSQEIWY